MEGLSAPLLLRPPSSQFTTNTSSKPGQTGTRPRRGKDAGFHPRLPATTGARSKGGIEGREEGIGMTWHGMDGMR